jgi:hypothetical protein
VSRFAPGVAKAGRVSPGTPIELERAIWEVDGTFPGRASGDRAVLKSVRLEEDSVLQVGRAEQVGLRDGLFRG